MGLFIESRVLLFCFVEACRVLRWSAIATHLPRRTDNEIKNYWNTHLKKRLAKMGIDPVTHKPKSDAILSSDGHSKHAANLSHMAQWESARLEAEARLVRQSKLRSNSFLASPEFSTPSSPLNKPSLAPPRCLDILKAWNGVWAKPNEPGASGVGGDLESPTSTVSYSENNAPQVSTSNRMGDSSTAFYEFVGNNSSGSCDGGIMKEEGEEDWKGLGSTSSLPEGIQDMTMPLDSGAAWNGDSLRAYDQDEDHARGGGNFVERFTDLLLSNASAADRSISEGCGESENGAVTTSAAGPGSEYLEDNKNYWNSILNLVNSSPTDSPMF